MIAALCASCGNVVPSRPASPAIGSPAPTASRPAPTISPTASPIEPVGSTPAPTPSASAPAGPPYRIILSGGLVPQEPGTIIFGSLPGTVADAWLEPFLTWPDGGLTYEAKVAFGAFWGEPAGVSEIRITLYRLGGGTLDLVWSDQKRISPDATGYLDGLVPFKGPGTYRLEVTRGPILLAWGIAYMGPRCETNCSGG